MKIKKIDLKNLIACAVVPLAFAQPSQALDNDLTLYLWGAGVSGGATINQQSIPSQPVEMDFDNLIDNLEMGFQMHYEGTGDRWGGGFDFTGVEFSNTNDAGVKAEIKSTLTEAFVIYQASEIFNLLGGVRFTGVDMTMSVPGFSKAEGDRSLTDFYVGGRVAVPFSDSWRGMLRADVGAGDSDLVWNVVAGLDWQMSQSWAMRGGYRWLDYQLEKDDANVENQLDLGLDGPFLGIAFQW